jgi:hypothetical protein
MDTSADASTTESLGRGTGPRHKHTIEEERRIVLETHVKGATVVSARVARSERRVRRAFDVAGKGDDTDSSADGASRRARRFKGFGATETSGQSRMASTQSGWCLEPLRQIAQQLQPSGSHNACEGILTNAVGASALSEHHSDTAIHKVLFDVADGRGILD